MPAYDYVPDRDRRWQMIVDRFCVIETKNEAGYVVPRLVRAGVKRVLEIGSH